MFKPSKALKNVDINELKKSENKRNLKRKVIKSLKENSNELSACFHVFSHEYPKA